jgi:hypothetical protein
VAVLILIAIVGIGIAAISLLLYWKIGSLAIPTILGLLLMYAICVASTRIYPPTPELILLSAFILGLSIALIAWGVSNYYSYRLIATPQYIHKKYDENTALNFYKLEKAPYGVFYGYVPWGDLGASYFAEFLNTEVWGRGYKVAFMDVAEIEIGGQPWALVWGIVLPKTFIDRILY